MLDLLQPLCFVCGCKVQWELSPRDAQLSDWDDITDLVLAAVFPQPRHANGHLDLLMYFQSPVKAFEQSREIVVL